MLPLHPSVCLINGAQCTHTHTLSQINFPPMLLYVTLGWAIAFPSVSHEDSIRLFLVKVRCLRDCQEDQPISTLKNYFPLFIYIMKLKLHFLLLCNANFIQKY